MNRRLVIIAAPFIALLLLLLAPAGGPEDEALAVACVALVMAAWWMTEAIPIPVTALLPLVLFPLLGVASIDTIARSYADPLIFLFLGGFLLAQAMQRWKLTVHVAQFILRFTGERPAGVLAGVMAATAFLSMWVSNTATAMVMVPIGHSIANSRAGPCDGACGNHSPFASALMLGIAYAATIGGMGTLIGTPPNALFAGFVREAYGIEVGFAQWMLVGVPAVVALLPLAWLILARIAFTLPSKFGTSSKSVSDANLHQPLSPGARRTAVVVGLAAAGWILRPVLVAAVPGLEISDTAIALIAAVALFIVPNGSAEGGPLLTWEDASKIRWDVLILFGGGLALAGAISSSKLAEWIGAKVTGLAALSLPVVLLLLIATVVMIGELASNTATAAIFLPIAAATAPSMGMVPIELALPVALAATLGFMLPVATPPNAIVFGTGDIHASEMLRTGVLLNVAGIIVVTAISLTAGRWVFSAG